MITDFVNSIPEIFRFACKKVGKALLPKRCAFPTNSESMPLFIAFQLQKLTVLS
jgi:hypothetical protein